MKYKKKHKLSQTVFSKLQNSKTPKHRFSYMFSYELRAQKRPSKFENINNNNYNKKINNHKNQF